LNFQLTGILFYILIQLIIGAVVCKYFVKSDSDYFLGGRRLGPIMATLSIFATWFGAETCIGAAGEVFKHGLTGSRADPWGYAICLFLMAFYASRLWKGGYTTIGDLFRERFSNVSEKILLLILVPTSILWAAAQIRAFGMILSASSPLSLNACITLAAGLVIVYTVMGGLLADAVTDLIQGSILIIGLFVLFVVVLSDIGDPITLLKSIDPERMQIFRPNGEPIWETIETWCVPILGSITTQELIARVLASKNSKVAVRSCFNASWIYLIIGIIPITLGLLAHGLKLSPEISDQVLPFLAGKYFNKYLYVIFAGALVSAILSTVDSTLLAISSLLSHNLVYPMLDNPTPKTKLIYARVFVVVSGVFAFGLALSREGVYALVEEASSFGGAGCVVVFTFGLFTKFGGKWSARSALISGAIVSIVGDYILHLQAPYTYSLFVSFAAYVGVELFIRYRNYFSQKNPEVAYS